MVFGKFMMGALYTTMIGGAVLFHEGAITVNVKEMKKDGEAQRVFVVAPAAIVPWAIKLMPQGHMPRLPEEARLALPAMQAAVDELERIPDTVLVEVDSRDEHVKVSKEGGYFIVDVKSDREEVHVSVPIRAARHTLEELLERATEKRE
jgi:hypothetical protein